MAIVGQSNPQTDDKRTAIEREIEHTDRRIDELVYELYGLFMPGDWRAL